MLLKKNKGIQESKVFVVEQYYLIYHRSYRCMQECMCMHLDRGRSIFIEIKITFNLPTETIDNEGMRVISEDAVLGNNNL